MLTHACLTKPGSQQSAQQEAESSLTFREQRRRHPGIESAIGALQVGNGLHRWRDRIELGFERYVALSLLGRNLHVLGKLLLAQEDGACKAAISKRAAA